MKKQGVFVMYDSIIIGAGPAGLAAAIYASRAGLNALVIEESPVNGGQVLSTYEVDNYPGLPGISGLDLGEKFSDHAINAGANKVEATVKKVETLEAGKRFKVVTSEGDFETATVVVATGATHAKLNVPGEEELAGMGVSYCATCDGAFFKGLDVCVVGGSDVAVEDAIYLSRTCQNVFLIHRRDSLRAANSLVEAASRCSNIHYIWNSEVKKINGEDEVTDVEVFNKVTGESSKLQVNGVFIAVGIVPATSFLDGQLEMNDKGYVIASEDCRTSIPGIYVAGDIRQKPMRQIITAVADGANAINSVSEDLRGNM